ncbi:MULTISPECIES: hypothetical protein [Pseudomonas syringae group]|uniref:Uncharacterized protein n=4 Tax=Pseudomonas syringae group TaxID=136849 RepID=A0AAD0DXR9_9PSED|nr:MULTISPECIES: hypothetical protein [Pseudomonas syringae group]AVB18103.1 hypothetical protein BKM03_01530 [Pseudomonas avellanae]EGH08590.1 hypothetical protein PSYMP_07133 [Pseudomonas amygdali pv. morsprunorum str. M302280]KWS61869.1 hypothetical protein AL055_27465 [Pseudomonas amygdali pv. morsprunorum]PHN35405.1 hypothetical protein AO261_01420 [Pseudomonas avellanae]POC86593.1 hypothetical protein BKM26_20475 [Pseudomonas avellanae]
MKRTTLLVLALSVLSASLAQAAEQLKVSTYVKVDGKALPVQIDYVESGKQVIYAEHDSIEYVTSVTKGVERKKVRALGLSGKITPRLVKPDGTVRITGEISFVGIDRMRTVKYGASDYQLPEFWSHLIALSPKKGNVGEAITLDHYSGSGHVLDVEVTVTLP